MGKNTSNINALKHCGFHFMNPKVTIIILNWNGWKDTLECLESLEQINYNNYDVIVVDNHSQDNSVQKIKNYLKSKVGTESNFIGHGHVNGLLNYFEYAESENTSIEEEYGLFKNTILIKNSENYGFAGGNNVGIRFALQNLDPDYILLLNNDTVVDKNFLEKLVFTCLNDKNIALIQSKLLEYETYKVDSTGGIFDRYGFGISRGLKENDTGKYDENKEDGFFYVLGTCMLVSVDFINETDPDEFLDSNIFAIHDDVDISWHARILGYKIAYCPSSICFHKQHKSFKKKTSIYINFLISKNSIYILLKYYSIKNIVIYLPLKLIIDFTLSLGRIFVNKDTDQLKTYFQAILWNSTNLNNTLKRRKKIQSKRKVNDKEIIKYMEPYSLRISNLKTQYSKK